ncbi:hypothetical protein [Mucilaginibacter lacusdianchii]|uniref:hypothetical protein n=1 Tax=Mucilaginibacter lacusdianchii TaxID=2684211 RepID=UPI00131DB74A|nr:hypothetical protein [Mucilaginibacter sp. JXJ CY 39]
MKLITWFILLPLIIYRAYGQNTQQTVRIQLPKLDKVVLYSDAPFIVSEGYDGNDILVSPQQSLADTLLKYPLLADNSSSGDSSIKYQSQLRTGVNGFLFNEIRINTNCRSIKIQVPNHMPLLAFEFKTTLPDGLIQVRNYAGPVQIAAYFCRLEVERLTGPFWISNDYGKVSLKYISWSNTAKWSLYDHPYMVRSASSNIELSVPDSLKAYFSLSNGKGRVYSKLRFGPGLLLNDGGIGISVTSTTGNIYLNQEKN